MRRFLILFLAAAPPCAAWAAPRITPDGEILCGPLRLRLAWFDGEWRMTGQERGTVFPAPGYPLEQPELFELEGTLRLFHDAGELRLTERVELLPGTLKYRAALRGKPGMPCRSAALILELPVAEFGGKTLKADGGPSRSTPFPRRPPIPNSVRNGSQSRCRKASWSFRENSPVIFRMNAITAGISIRCGSSAHRNRERKQRSAGSSLRRNRNRRHPAAGGQSGDIPGGHQPGGQYGMARRNRGRRQGRLDRSGGKRRPGPDARAAGFLRRPRSNSWTPGGTAGKAVWCSRAPTANICSNPPGSTESAGAANGCTSCML